MREALNYITFMKWKMELSLLVHLSLRFPIPSHASSPTTAIGGCPSLTPRGMLCSLLLPPFLPPLFCFLRAFLAISVSVSLLLSLMAAAEVLAEGRDEETLALLLFVVSTIMDVPGCNPRIFSN